MHDARRTLGTQHAAIHRMIGITLDIAQGAILQMHLDAAAAGAHIAGGVFHFVADGGRQVDFLGVAGHDPQIPIRLTPDRLIAGVGDRKISNTNGTL